MTRSRFFGRLGTGEVGGNIFKADEEEGLSAFDAFSQAVGRGADASAEPEDFVGV